MSETKKKRVVLHVGHAKTGTSALQSFFARNAEGLARNGVLYPDLVDLGDAAQGRISTGNGGDLATCVRQGDPYDRPAALDRLRGMLAAAAPAFDGGPYTILISSEMFLYFDPVLMEALVEEFARHGYRTEAICFLRDYADFLFSYYLQHVKRAQCTQSFAEFATERQDDLVDLVRRLRGIKARGFSYHLFNYGDAKEDIAGFFLREVLGVNADDLGDRATGPRIVNRSITGRETEFLAMVNRLFERNTYPQISDRLVYASPDPRFENLPSAEDMALLERLGRDTVSEVNTELKGTPLRIGGRSAPNSEDDYQTMLRLMALLFRFVEDARTELSREIRDASTTIKSLDAHGRTARDLCTTSSSLRQAEEKLRAAEARASMLAEANERVNAALRDAFSRPGRNLVRNFVYRAHLIWARRPTGSRQRRIEREAAARARRPY